VTALGPHALDLPEALAQLELQRLAWLYCHAVDRGDMALLRSLYTDDATDDHGGMFRGTAEEYVAWLPAMLAALDATRHTIDSMVFVVDGDRAQGELVNTAYHRTGDQEVIVRGRYLDSYARRDGIWRIRHRSLVMDAFEQRTTSEAGGFIGKGVEWGTADSSDPVHTRLDLFSRQD
jgi:ketosteroid isomerase-like protein